MQTALLLLVVSQLDGLKTWTDARGIVHVASAVEAPHGARDLGAGSYSVIDADGRPLVLADGGTRVDDVAWWRAQFKKTRATLAATRSQEELVRSELAHSRRELCVEARAVATSQVVVIAPSTSVDHPLRARPGRVVTQTREEVTQRRCAAQPAPSSLLAAVTTARDATAHAEAAVLSLEREAAAAGLPRRDWQ